MMTPDRRVGLRDTAGVDQFAAAGTGDGLLVGAVLAEPRVVGLSVRADGRDRDPVMNCHANGMFSQGRSRLHLITYNIKAQYVK